MSLSASSLQSDVCVNGDTGQAALRDIMRGAHCEEINSLVCFPTTNIQSTSKPVALHFLSVFFRLGATTPGAPTCSVRCGINSTIDV